MKPINIIILVFLGVAVAVFLAIAFGYIAYADSTNYFDREGSTGMAFIFVFAPVSGLIAGIISAVVTFRILKKRGPV